MSGGIQRIILVPVDNKTIPKCVNTKLHLEIKFATKINFWFFRTEKCPFPEFAIQKDLKNASMERVNRSRQTHPTLSSIES